MQNMYLDKGFLRFKDFYKDQIIKTLQTINKNDIMAVVKLVEKAIRARKNTLYIFGNGGSHSLAHHFGVNLSDSLKNTTHGIKFNYGIDFHMSQANSSQGQYENIFVETLQTEKADDEDLVILISGSGDSDNILQVADYCIKHNIPTVSFSGFDGGKIAHKKISHNIIAAIPDQQICEDVIQLLLHIISESVIKQLNNQSYKLENLFSDKILSVTESFNNVEVEFLLEISKSVAEAFIDNKTVFVLGPEGHGLSISAEHIAHNFNWDAVFQIKTPPRRKLVSSPTYADFSGVGNDRLIPGVVIIQQLDKAENGDVVLFFIHDFNNPTAKQAIDKANFHKMNIFVIAGKEHVDYKNINYCYIKSDYKLFTGDMTQALGHLIARLIRFRLKIFLQELSEGEDVFSFLANEDMAQRRLLDKKDL